jgi:hypothetical protein
MDNDSVCELHGVELSDGRVPIAYGAPIPRDFEYFQAAQKLFPHGITFVLGGCNPQEQTHRETRICSECRAAEQAWRREEQ